MITNYSQINITFLIKLQENDQLKFEIIFAVVTSLGIVRHITLFNTKHILALQPPNTFEVKDLSKNR